MPSFDTAFKTLVAQEYADHVRYSSTAFPALSAEEWTARALDPDNEENDDNLIISQRVGQRVVEKLGPEFVDFGVFDNCREVGLTFTTAGWQFAVYEHRNSDEICVQGCPLSEVRPYGPYGDHGDASKYDVLGRSRWRHYDQAADQLIAALRAVNDYRNASLADDAYPKEAGLPYVRHVIASVEASQ